MVREAVGFEEVVKALVVVGLMEAVGLEVAVD